MRVPGREVCVPQAVCVHHYMRGSAGFPKRATFAHLSEFMRFDRLRAGRHGTGRMI